MDFSVLLSVYQKEKPEYFRQSLDSILSQTCLPTQIVLVEDGPLTEELYREVEALSQRTDRLKVVPLKENMGLGKALNIGIRECDYELVARMDTDDIAFPDRFALQIEAFERDPELGLCGGYVEEFIDSVENVVSVKKVPLKDEEIRRYAKKRNPFNHPTVMFKKSEVEKAGGYQHALYFEDYYLWMRMLKNRVKAKNIDRALLHFRTGADMYQRRGGFAYMKHAVAFKKRLYREGLISFGDYLVSASIHVAVSLMPNSLRGWVYSRLLRKRKADGNE